MTIEEAREYWCRRLERAEGYSDEHWDAEERHAHKDYIDAMTHAITALAICREQAQTVPQKTNGDRIRQMTDEELAEWFAPHMMCNECERRLKSYGCDKGECAKYALIYMKKVVSEDADK